MKVFDDDGHDLEESGEYIFDVIDDWVIEWFKKGSLEYNSDEDY